MTMNLLIRDVPKELWADALYLAQQYMREFPDSFGYHQGIIYLKGTRSYYVYKTKTRYVVRGV